MYNMLKQLQFLMYMQQLGLVFFLFNLTKMINILCIIIMILSSIFKPV